MRSTILSVLILSFTLLVGSTAYAQSDSHEIKKVCIGQGKYAAVVEHNKQFYVIVSREMIQKNFRIMDLTGAIQMGGYTYMRYFHNSNRSEMPVRVLSRMQWKYSGFPGARAVCRDIVNRRFM